MQDFMLKYAYHECVNKGTVKLESKKEINKQKNSISLSNLWNTSSTCKFSEVDFRALKYSDARINI